MFKFFDPIGLEAATKQASDTLFVALTAPFHGVGEAPARDDVAVVLVSDRTLDRWDGSWPAVVSRHARAVETILSARPKAVMVDFRFAKPRQGENLHEFDDAIAMAARLGVPLLFSRGPLGNGYEPLPAPLTEHGTVTGWQGANRYNLLVTPVSDGLAAEDGPLQPTAAFDLYERLCATGSLKSCHERPERAQFERPMVVRFGMATDPNQSMAMDTCGCARFGGALPARMVQAGALAARVLSDKLRVFDSDPVQRCPTLLTVDAADLELNEVGNPAVPMTTLLTNRVVFYGSDLRGEHDVVEVPFRGQVPGVAALATVFENLDLYGTAYFKQPASIIEGVVDITWGDVVEGGIWLLLVVCLILREQHVDWVDGLADGEALRGRILLAIAMAAFVGTLAVVDYQSRDGGAYVSRSLLFGGLLLYFAVFVLLLSVTARWHRLGMTYRGRLLQLVALTTCLFTCNEAWLHWPNGDWLGLVLLFVAFGEAFEGKSGSFVADVEMWLAALGRRLFWRR